MHDKNETIVIIAVTTIAIAAMLILKVDASEIVSGVCGGLVGYLTKSSFDNKTKDS